MNKIDLQAARPDEIREEIEHDPRDRPERGPGRQRQDRAGRPRALPRDHRADPAPRGKPDAPLRALIFDSKFDDYQGVITYVRVVDGTLRDGQKIRLMAGETEHEVLGLGRFRPHRVPCDELGVGQVGYVVANIKRLSDVRIGDTITDASPTRRGGPARLPGADAGRLLRPLPGEHNQFEELRDALAEARAERLQLHLRARDLRRPRLRLPLRVPGPAPHGDRPAAARAREQPRRWSRRRRTSPTRSSPSGARPSTSPTRPASPTPARSRSSASRSPA